MRERGLLDSCLGSGERPLFRRAPVLRMASTIIDQRSAKTMNSYLGRSAPLPFDVTTDRTTNYT